MSAAPNALFQKLDAGIYYYFLTYTPILLVGLVGLSLRNLFSFFQTCRAITSNISARAGGNIQLAEVLRFVCILIKTAFILL